MRRLLLALVLVAGLFYPVARECLACTVIFARGGGEVLGANNEDFFYPHTVMTVLPASVGKHGVLFFGFDQSWQQGAINDKGLFFDGLALPRAARPSRSKKPVFRGSILEKVMLECATVKQVVVLFSRYRVPFLDKAQLMFGDRLGNSVIIERDRAIRRRGSYQVATNFRQSAAKRPTCPRHRIARQMLKRLRASKTSLKSVLAAVHNEGAYPTTYSNIYDLKRGKVYLYHFHNFQQEVVLDVDEELAKGRRKVPIAALFPRIHAAEVFMKSAKDKIEVSRLALEKKATRVERPREYLGRYTLQPVARDVSVGLGRAGLYVEERELGRLRLYSRARDRFSFLLMGRPCPVRFERDKEGRVIGFRATIFGEALRARRVQAPR